VSAGAWRGASPAASHWRRSGSASASRSTSTATATPTIAAGARLELQKKTLQNGSAAVWSGTTGAIIREWRGEWPDGLFGHWVMPIPDLSGDGLADLVIAAPHGGLDGRVNGIVVARSPKTGEELWKREATDGENLGWDLTLAGDQDGDGRTDLFVGAPAGDSGAGLSPERQGRHGAADLCAERPREAPSAGTSRDSTISTGTGAPTSPSARPSQPAPTARRSERPGSSRRRAAR
jgi:hypothetical protein